MPAERAPRLPIPKREIPNTPEFRAARDRVDALLRPDTHPDDRRKIGHVLAAWDDQHVLPVMVELIGNIVMRVDANAALRERGSLTRDAVRDAHDYAAALRRALLNAIDWHEKYAKSEHADVFRDALTALRSGPLGRADYMFENRPLGRSRGNPDTGRQHTLEDALYSTGMFTRPKAKLSATVLAQYDAASILAAGMTPDE